MGDFGIGSGTVTLSDRVAEAQHYGVLYQSTSYGMGEKRQKDVRRLLSKHKGLSLLDIGAGRGEGLQIARECGYLDVHGVEPVKSLLAEDISFGYAHDLGFPDDSYDTVTCFDVLEHLLSEDIGPAIEEMCRIGRKVIISAATYSSMVNGRELHISRRSEQEWEDTIKAHAKGRTVTRDGYAGIKSPAFIVQ